MIKSASFARTILQKNVEIQFSRAARESFKILFDCLIIFATWNLKKIFFILSVEFLCRLKVCCFLCARSSRSSGSFRPRATSASHHANIKRADTHECLVTLSAFLMLAPFSFRLSYGAFVSLLIGSNRHRRPNTL